MKFIHLKLNQLFNKLIFIFCYFLLISNGSVSSPLEETAPDSTIYNLEKLNVRHDTVTLSGFSSGASMAIQTHLAHSSLFSGVAIFSQVFYHCGHTSLLSFALRCARLIGSNPIFPYPLSKSIADARMYESLGLIDPLVSLKGQRIWIWSGSDDEYLPESMVRKNEEFYNEFMGLSLEGNVRLIIRPKAKHLLPTEGYGAGCDEDAADNYYLGNCSYSGALESLRFLLGKAFISPPVAGITLSELKQFNQSEFTPKTTHDLNFKCSWMGDRGWIYIPRKCQDGVGIKCHLHVNFHGCNEWPPEVAEEYIKHSGFLEVAEQNNIVLLFPLTTKLPGNMGGCWDFYGYSGKLFGTKHGKQIQVVHQMLMRILYGINHKVLPGTS